METPLPSPQDIQQALPPPPGEVRIPSPESNADDPSNIRRDLALDFVNMSLQTISYSQKASREGHTVDFSIIAPERIAAYSKAKADLLKGNFEGIAAIVPDVEKNIALVSQERQLMVAELTKPEGLPDDQLYYAMQKEMPEAMDAGFELAEKKITAPKAYALVEDHIREIQQRIDSTARGQLEKKKVENAKKLLNLTTIRDIGLNQQRKQAATQQISQPTPPTPIAA